MLRRSTLVIAAALSTAAVLWATLGPALWRTDGHEVPGGILNPLAWTAPSTWSTGYLSEITLNVIMFVPIGALATAMLPRRAWPVALFAGVALTVGIELIQLPLPDRISDPRDLVANTAGAIVGIAAVVLIRLVRGAGGAVRHAAARRPVEAPAGRSRATVSGARRGAPARAEGARSGPTTVEPAHAVSHRRAA